MPCKYSPVGPIKILEQLQDRGVLGNYLLLIAHEVLADDIGYACLLDNEHDAGDPDELIILDNGVVEKGTAMPLGDLLNAAEITLPDCIVMPDILGEFDATRKLLEDQAMAVIDCPFPLMLVPQGKDLDEVKQCVDWLYENLYPMWPKKNYWGVPRWMANKLGSRAPVIDYINSHAWVADQPRIHLLGMSNNWEDDLLCTIHTNVIGIDSANPIIRALGGLGMNYINNSDHTFHLPRGCYWGKTEINATVLENIAHVREAIA